MIATAVGAFHLALALGAVANAATPGKRERNLWLPVVLGMLALSLFVATS